MRREARRAGELALALVLGGLVAVFAWRARGPSEGSSPALAGVAFPAARATEARALFARLIDGLLLLQEGDGGFALDRPEDRLRLPEPEVKRTAASALAAWALAQGVARGLGEERVRAARDRAWAYLLARQQPDGSLGRMPASPVGVTERGPEVTALAASLLAWGQASEPAQLLAQSRATRALAPLLAGGLRDGWQRALVAMAIDAQVAAGRGEGLGREPRKALALGATKAEPDCGDYRLAEAIVRVARGEAENGDLYPEAVLAACLTREATVWSGQTTDLQSWLMQAWLAARSRQGPAWFAAVLAPLAEAPGQGGLVPGGIYADRVTQTACGALVLALGLASQDLVK